jgi:hypothetical protein
MEQAQGFVEWIYKLKTISDLIPERRTGVARLLDTQLPKKEPGTAILGFCEANRITLDQLINLLKDETTN